MSDNIRAHAFNGSMKLIGKGSKVLAEDRLDINGALLNPKSCVYARELIQTGISAIYTMKPSWTWSKTVSHFCGKAAAH